MTASRVLILTSSTGAGHDAHAEAFAEWSAHLYGSAVEVRIERPLENSSWIGRQGVSFYNFIQRRAPGFHHVYYHFAEGLSLLHRNSVALGRSDYIRLLESFRPHVILSVHDCLNRGYFSLARRVLGPAVRCVTFCLEFDGGYGFSRNWVDRSADLFLGRTPESTAAGVRRGLPEARCRALGDLFPPRFSAPRMSAREKATYLRDRLGLSDQRLTLLLATGGAGAENHLAFLEALKALDVQVIALCGRDSRSLARLADWSQRHPGFHLRALPYSAEIPELLQVSSAVVARGGGIAAEALFFGCPFIFNTLGGTMPQEIPTIRYFHARQIAAVVRRQRDLATIVQRWLRQPASHTELQRRVIANQSPYHPAQLVASVLAEEGASKPLDLEVC